jgi:type I restriction enzyme S subunit
MKEKRVKPQGASNKSVDDLLQEALIKDRDRPYKVPDNWLWTWLVNFSKPGQYSFVDGPFGSNLKVSDYTGKGIRLIQLQNIGVGYWRDENKKYISEKKAIELTRSRTLPGDIVIAKMAAPIARATIVPEIEKEYLIVADCVRISVSKYVVTKYLNYCINSPYIRNIAEKWGKGTTRKRINLKDLKKLPVPLPPLEEQVRIVKKLDSMLGKIAEARELIQEARESFETRRTLILHKAFAGELTRKWRGENQNIETASKLLETIQNNRKIRYEEEDKKSKVRFGKKQKELDNSIFEYFEFDKNFELPPKWVIHNIRAIADLITDGEHVTPKRSKDGYLLLSARNIQNGYLNLDKVDHIPEDEFIRITKRCNPEEGDLLVSCSGSVGRVCRVPKDLKFAMVRSIALIKLQSNKYLSRFLEFLFQSDLIQNQITKLQKATAQANLFVGPIGKIVIVIPPIKEQKEIVRIIHELIENEEEARELIDLENSIDFLEKSILSKAFRGQLGTNDPKDEPAIKLLKKILKEKKEMKRLEPKKVKKRGEDFMDGSKRMKLEKRFNLVEVLKESKQRMKPETLLKKSGYNHETIEEFYRELKNFVENNEIFEERPNNSDVFLRIKNHENRETVDKKV